MTIVRIFEVTGKDNSLGRDIDVSFQVKDADENIHLVNADTDVMLNIPKSMALEVLEAISLLLEK